MTTSADLLSALRVTFGTDPMLHIEHVPGRSGQVAPWPDWVPAAVREAYAARAVQTPWRHQVQAATFAHSGQHVVISTGTASGKSLAYQLPISSALLDDPQATALYLAPTKALGADQLESFNALQLPSVRATPYDGDTPREVRAWARSHGRFLLTNPDMLHLGILPNHARWSRLLRGLAYVVVDECHSYRGVFGSHVALVLRRLRRLAARYGAAPTFILASATVAHPDAVAERLIGAPTVAVTEDAAPHAAADFVLWEPPSQPSGAEGASPRLNDFDGAAVDDFWGTAPVEPARDEADAAAHQPETAVDGSAFRRSASSEAARVMSTLVAAGARTLVFVRSRAGAEHVALTAAQSLERTRPELAARVSAYRGGYLPEDRRALEKSFDRGDLVAVASTNALELGVDIAGINATVMAGYPGTLASLWQQAGRAGRAEDAALVVFIARDDPLDTYLVRHPEAVFAAPVEAAVINPANPHVLAPHLACAAAEGSLNGNDLDFFGGTDAETALRQLIADKVVRRRPAGVFYTGRDHPAGHISLRGSSHQVAVVESDTGRLLGTEDALRAPASIHPGAIYVHQGRSYEVSQLLLDDGVALVDACRRDWWTSARSTSTVDIVRELARRDLPDGSRLSRGTVLVTEQVTGYYRRLADGSLLDSIDLDMPEHRLETHAVWYTLPPANLLNAGVVETELGGALHAAEHAAIGLLPLFAGCDRWDIGGLSTALHSDTGLPTVIVYDGMAGGAGFAEHGFEVALDWLGATHRAIVDCPCSAGCPSCVQSPKCGNGNQPLSKVGAVAVLGLMVSALGMPATG